MKKIVACFLVILCIAVNNLSAQTTVETKKGWSQKKKATVIGAAAGAVTGAAVSNKRGKGALIGGAVGAGAGYAYGSHRQKRHPKTIIKRKTVISN